MARVHKYAFDNLVDKDGKTVVAESNKAIDSRDLEELKQKARDAGKRFKKEMEGAGDG